MRLRWGERKGLLGFTGREEPCDEQNVGTGGILGPACRPVVGSVEASSGLVASGRRLPAGRCASAQAHGRWPWSRSVADARPVMKPKVYLCPVVP